MINYNPDLQFRCTIIRGKAKNMLDDLLPSYSQIINDICPCSITVFRSGFNTRLKEILNKDKCTKKTLDNHRTEIAGKLFGMYFESHGIIYPSKRTIKYLEDADQPAFFKDICAKFQFPNGMDKLDKVLEKVNLKISLRQFPFILQLLIEAKNIAVLITKNDIAYYVLNSLEVLQGKISPNQVLSKILEDRNNGVEKKVSYEGKKDSYCMQHIREQLNLLELANLIKITGDIVRLNENDLSVIIDFAKYADKKPEFDVYKYDFTKEDDKKRFYKEWEYYYSELNSQFSFNTSLESLITSKDSNIFDKNALGDEGELFVLAHEKERVKRFDPRLLRKVVHLGKTRGLGYDIQSVVAESGEYPEFVKYIEVKSTKRVTVPNMNGNWIDTINLTRNEWVAAEQHRDSYSIYRVYFTPEKVIVYAINDPYGKNQNGSLQIVPLTYRMDFTEDSIKFVTEREVGP